MNIALDTFVHRMSVLAGLDEPALQFLGNLAQESAYEAGAVIVREGEPGDRVYFICEGRVRIMKDSAAEGQVPLAEFGAGEVFGEMSLVASVARSASVFATEPTRVFTLRGVDFLRLYEKRPDQYGIVMLNLARDLARRLRALDESFCHRNA